MHSASWIVRRWVNGLRRVAAGLPRSEEAVWPGVRNDLFVAHESIYAFAARFVPGRRVLDAACGTGYGSFLLAERGAASVLGIDRDRRRLRYARRHFRAPRLAFEEQDCSHLALAPGSFDVIVTSNTLEHLPEPGRFLAAAARALAPGGCAVVAVPPVLSAADLDLHAVNRFHLAPLSVHAWAELFRAGGWDATFFTHFCRRELDFSSPFPSSAALADFALAEAPVEAAYARAPLTALWVLRPRENAFTGEPIPAR